MTAVDSFVIQQAEIRASRLIGSHGFTRDHWDDLRQDLLLDYLERLPQFDGGRGDLRGFMFGVVRHRAAQLVDRLGIGVRGHHRTPARPVRAGRAFADGARRIGSP